MDHISDRLYELLLGCSHGNMSRPFTIHNRTYRVCFDCGRELQYSLSNMQIVSTRDCGNNGHSELAVQHSQ